MWTGEILFLFTTLAHPRGEHFFVAGTAEIASSCPLKRLTALHLPLRFAI
jgi:hypothetical protein